MTTKSDQSAVSDDILAESASVVGAHQVLLLAFFFIEASIEIIQAMLNRSTDFCVCVCVCVNQNPSSVVDIVAFSVLQQHQNNQPEVIERILNSPEKCYRI